MKRNAILIVAGVWLVFFSGEGVRAQKPPLLPEKDVAALANEVSGETAKRNLEGIARFHRQRGSKGFHEAAELVAERLRAYGLSDVAILQFPADGKIFYGTQRSRPAWDAEVGKLWEVSPTVDVGYVPKRMIEDIETEPIVLAEDSESADVIAEVVEVGEGTHESDYAGKNVKGKIVLVSAQPGAVQDLAVGKFGAAGIISYAQNQKTAWWGENYNAIRWGHLDTFSRNKTFAFMVSLNEARKLRTIQPMAPKDDWHGVHAVVNAGQHPGNYEVVTATIPGADAKLKDQEIAFSCHLDHQRPGANDNASGCATILEVARTLQKLIDEKRVERPARTIRFVFPPEIEGTLALLNGKGQYATWNSGEAANNTSVKVSDNFLLGPELAKRIKAVIHMDMVGGGPETKAVFHVTRGPMSLPSFVHDVAWAFAEWVNEESYKFAATGKADYPLVAPEGGKEPLRAEYSAFTMGSDHDVYQDSSFGIPAIYLNDWPDRYIHTNFDTAANIDTTKLKRAAFIGAASGYFLAKMTAKDTSNYLLNSEVLGGRLIVEMTNRISNLSPAERGILNEAVTEYIERENDSMRIYVGDSAASSFVLPRGPQNGEGSQLVFARHIARKGPLVVFGYDYFADHAKTAGVGTPKLLSYQGLWGAGEEYAYEVLNFADGKRNGQQICEEVSAEYGPVPLEMVVEYLRALEKIGVVEQVK